MTWILANWQTILAVIGGVVGAATAIVGLARIIAAITPSPADDTFVGKVADVLSKLIEILKRLSLIK